MNEDNNKANDDVFLGQRPKVERNSVICKLNLIFKLLPWKNGYLK